MLKLSNILTMYKDIKAPTIENNGWALDVYSPEDFELRPDCNIKIKAGFGLNLPSGIGGLISPKNAAIHFSVSPGQLIHPEFDGELTINLVYKGRSTEMIRKGDPLCQVVFGPRLGLEA